MIQYIWQVGVNWDNRANHTFEYNGQGLQTKYEIDYWGDTTWYKSALYITEYNQYGDKVSFEKQIWAYQNWTHSERYIYAYDNLSSINPPTSGELTFQLFNNFPNPFNPSTIIKYQIPEYSNVQIKIYDVLGKEVAQLVNEEKIAGYHEVEFNGSHLASGVYFYRIQAGDFVETKKMILMK